MYDRLDWQGDAKQPVGVHARQKDVDAHCGDARSFLRRHERAAARAAQAGREAILDIAPHLLKRVADARNLRVAWDYLRRHGGKAPGPNGLTYDRLENFEVWGLLRALRTAIRDDNYRPGPDRKKRIPKVSGKGTRTLRLQNVEDRVVQRGIVQIIQPLLDPGFDDHSDGYRPGRNRQQALAKALRLLQSGNLVWIVADIKDAFDHVPHQRLLDISRTRLPEADNLVRLIQVTLANGTKRGLRQGSPLAPLLLNLYLDHHLDRVWRKEAPDTPLLRTADDILISCRSLRQARKAHARLRQLLLPTGMLLKKPRRDAIADLRIGNTAKWLGYAIAVGTNGPEVRIADDAWNRLEQRLALAHFEPAAPLRAIAIVNGWLDQLGPCYADEDRDQAYARVKEIAGRLAFDELPDQVELTVRWRAAYARWKRLYMAVRDVLCGGFASHADFSAERVEAMGCR